MAALATRPIRTVRVYSPRRDSREQFAREARALHNIDIVPVASAEACVDGADVIMAATSSMVRVLEPRWLKPGVHVSCIKSQEVDWEVIDACDRVFLHTSRQAKQLDNVMPDTPNVTAEHTKGWWTQPGRTLGSYPDLGQLVAGLASGRADRSEITCFVNNVGIGLQFAAAGALVLEKADAQGVGHVLPDDWFSEDVHP